MLYTFTAPFHAASPSSPCSLTLPNPLFTQLSLQCSPITPCAEEGLANAFYFIMIISWEQLLLDLEILLRGVSNEAKLRTRLRNLYNFTKITPGLQVCTGIAHICDSRIGCNILVFRVIIRLKLQLGRTSAKQVQR